jgi:hypothetical protein
MNRGNAGQTGFEAQLDMQVTRADGSVEVYEDVGRESLVEEQKRRLIALPSFRKWLTEKVDQMGEED